MRFESLNTQTFQVLGLPLMSDGFLLYHNAKSLLQYMYDPHFYTYY